MECLEKRELFAAHLGAPDLNFGKNGVAIVFAPDLSRTSSPSNVIVSGNGNTIFGFGQFADQRTEKVGDWVYLLDDQGTPMPGFGNNGFLSASDLGFDFRIESIGEAIDGKLIVAGSSGDPYAYLGDSSYGGDFGFMRLNTDGTIDQSFGQGGIVVVDGEANDYNLDGLVVTPDGSIIAVGTSMVSTGEEYGALIKITGSGELSVNFGDAGTPGLNLFGFNTRPQELLLDFSPNYGRRILIVSEQTLVAADVNGDGKATPRDALQIINLLARTGEAGLDADSISAAVDGFFDVSADSTVSVLDALHVINFLSRQTTNPTASLLSIDNGLHRESIDLLMREFIEPPSLW